MGPGGLSGLGHLLFIGLWLCVSLFQVNCCSSCSWARSSVDSRWNQTPPSRGFLVLCLLPPVAWLSLGASHPSGNDLGHPAVPSHSANQRGVAGIICVRFRGWGNRSSDTWTRSHGEKGLGVGFRAPMPLNSALLTTRCLKGLSPASSQCHYVALGWPTFCLLQNKLGHQSPSWPQPFS